jgi:hypothetical protein
LRYIFVDEAGTSAAEPLSVVVGIIVHADKQCAPVEEAVARTLDLLPRHIRENHPIFHAKSIWGDARLRGGWPLEERKAILHAMMSIPRDLNLALAVGVCRRATQLPDSALKNKTLAQAHHAIAFQECIAHADLWIRKYADKNEVATVIAEDVPESKKLLRHVAKWLQTNGYTVPNEDVRMVQLADGIVPLVSKDEFRTRAVSRIRMPIHFVEKTDEPLLQIADACAFGFRRFLCAQSAGADFAHSILGYRHDASRFEIGESTGGIFS